jgi:hypothetical protein
MIKRFCLVAALGLIGVARTATDALSAKPAPITKPVTVEFWDRAGDNIKSDGQGVYTGKVFYGSSASGDMQVELERTLRRFNFLFYPIATACDPESEPSPSGMLSDGEGMSIRGMHHVPVGETRANTASFGTSVGFFRFLGQDTPNPPHCSIATSSLLRLSALAGELLNEASISPSTIRIAFRPELPTPLPSEPLTGGRNSLRTGPLQMRTSSDTVTRSQGQREALQDFPQCNLTPAYGSTLVVGRSWIK